VESIAWRPLCDDRTESITSSFEVPHEWWTPS
jgi:hypothetical protein